MGTVTPNWEQILAPHWEAIEAMPADGFTGEDRRRFERVDLRVEDILKKLEGLERRFEGVEVDIDELRGSKADKSEVSHAVMSDHEARLRVLENAYKDSREILQGIRQDLEPLREWRWKQLGALGVVVLIVEVIAHVVFK